MAKINIKTAAIVIDTFKLKIFKKHLDAAGFEYEKFNGPAGCITVKVKFDFSKFDELHNLVIKMNQLAPQTLNVIKIMKTLIFIISLFVFTGCGGGSGYEKPVALQKYNGNNNKRQTRTARF